MIQIDSLEVVYANGTRALARTSTSFHAGQFTVLLGASGAGKSTLLRALNGLVQPTAGIVDVEGVGPLLAKTLRAHRRRTGMIFQQHQLIGRASVLANVLMGRLGYHASLRTLLPFSVKEKQLALDAIERVGLIDYALRRADQLSGGQQQRVALARALATEPSILLLDEPFAALDRSLRLDMQIEVKRLQRRLGLTAVLVTHDQDEAMSVADRIAVMRGGRIEQLGTPVEVYDRPRTPFVAGFIGTTNRLPCEVVSASPAGATVLVPGGIEIAVPAAGPPPPPGPALLILRPEALTLHDEAAPGRFPVELGLAVPLGGQAIREARAADGTPLRTTEPRRGAIRDLGVRAWCGLAPGAQPVIFPTAGEEA